MTERQVLTVFGLAAGAARLDPVRVLGEA